MGLFTRSAKSTPVSVTRAADALFTPVQQRVLGVLFCNADRSFTAAEIIELAGTSAASVEHELDRLEAGELVLVRRVQNARHYQANHAAPTFNELRMLILKTSGVADVLRVALSSKTKKIRAAFVYGTVEQTSGSSGEIKVLVISDTLIYADLNASLAEAGSILGRKITPTLYSSRELARRVRANDPVTKRVLAQPRVWLMGVSSAEL